MPAIQLQTLQLRTSHIGCRAGGKYPQTLEAMETMQLSGCCAQQDSGRPLMPSIDYSSTSLATTHRCFHSRHRYNDTGMYL